MVQPNFQFEKRQKELAKKKKKEEKKQRKLDDKTPPSSDPSGHADDFKYFNESSFDCFGVQVGLPSGILYKLLL